MQSLGPPRDPQYSGLDSEGAFILRPDLTAYQANVELDVRLAEIHSVIIALLGDFVLENLSSADLMQILSATDRLLGQAKTLQERLFQSWQDAQQLRQTK